MLKKLLDLLAGKPLAARSPQWPRARAEHLKRQPACAVCGTTSGVEVHHVRPLHLFPELELDPQNMRSLCREDHWTFGHGRDWSAWNAKVDLDIANAREMIARRRYTR